MTTVNSSIIPGKVNNNGINDMSIPSRTTAAPPSPLHNPVLTLVTPKGELAEDVGTVWINVSEIVPRFGNVLDPQSPYYNPTALLISQLSAGGQASVGIRRVSANKEVSRTAMSAFLQKHEVPVYERDAAGNFVYDGNGDKIPTGETITVGASLVIKPDPEAKNKRPGQLVRRTIAAIPANGETAAVPETYVFPMFEGICGVGEEYNRGGMNMGINSDPMSQRNIAAFVRKTGVYPFQLRTFTENALGIRTYTKTADRREVVDFTLFETTYNNTDFSIARGFGEFTGTNANRKVTPRPAPYNSVHVYKENIDVLMQTLYAIEKPHNDTLLEVGSLHYQQMNPFTLTNHNGIPYHAIVSGDPGVVWDMSGAVRATGGVLPFYQANGQLPDYVDEIVVDDPFGVLAGVRFPISPAQAWQASNHMVKSDMQAYLDGAETKNYTKNRQSFWWDVGYSMEVKELALQLLASRKDIIVMLDATVWKPGETNTLGEIYSRATSLVTQARLYPESEKWGTASCRCAINLIEAKLTDEKTGDYFSMNLDLAYAFALFAGNNAGVVRAAFNPDSDDNRNLRTMHSPNIEFEDDPIAANNFDIGALTLRPNDTGGLFRPALITVYSDPDSVLKDLVSVFMCVCIEKIAQDEWNYLTGSTNKSSTTYAADYKDGVERKCRDRLGGVVRQVVVDASFAEGTVGSRAVMNSIGHAWFNKAKYMMNLDLFAYNEQDLA